uniref:Uncharacterized protein n=1 Tax=Setaria viridis TaxID=4556 RepID=A0A4U6UZR6_SETVI|nr:hypothetical protein SEVIR_4G121800v2 [Setaria viridis]
MEECLDFCPRLLEGTTCFTRSSRNPKPSNESKGMYLFDSVGEPIGKCTGVNLDKHLLVQAHRYVFRHCDELEDLHSKLGPSSNLTPCSIEKLTDEHFPNWLKKKAYHY